MKSIKKGLSRCTPKRKRAGRRGGATPPSPNVAEHVANQSSNSLLYKSSSRTLSYAWHGPPATYWFSGSHLPMTIRSRQMARTLQNGAHILRSVAIKKALHMMNFVEVHRLMKGFTLKIAFKILHCARCCHAAGEDQKRRGGASLTPTATPKTSNC